MSSPPPLSATGFLCVALHYPETSSGVEAGLEPISRVLELKVCATTAHPSGTLVSITLLNPAIGKPFHSSGILPKRLYCADVRGWPMALAHGTGLWWAEPHRDRVFDLESRGPMQFQSHVQHLGVAKPQAIPFPAIGICKIRCRHHPSARAQPESEGRMRCDHSSKSPAHPKAPSSQG